MTTLSPFSRGQISGCATAAIFYSLRRGASSLTPKLLLFGFVIARCLTGYVQAQALPEVWLQRYDPESTVLQEGNAIATDANGDVAVTGARFIGTNEAYYTAKYARDTGTLRWEQTYDSGNGEDVPASVVMDSAGNVIVTGYRTNASGIHDYYTIKYASATGDVLWEKFYEGPNGGLDDAIKVVVDSADNVIVTGFSAGDGTGQDIHTLKYRASDGAVLNQWRYNSPGNRDDRPTDMVVDGSDNIIVVGEVNLGDEAWFYTARYNGTGALGAIHWDEVRDDLPSPSFYGALGVAVDSDGNVFTTGRIRGADVTFEALTIKYATANGATLWDEFSEDFKLHSANDPIDIAVDRSGNAIVGVTLETQFGNTIGVIKYAAANGAFLWRKKTSAPGDDDTLTAVAVDLFGDVVIAGTSRNDRQVGASDDYYVLKLARDDGDSLFQDRRNGDNDAGEDIVRGLAVDFTGNIIVTGKSRKDEEVLGNTFQMLTVKYGVSTVANPFLLVTGDPVPGAGVPGSGVPEGASIRSISTPAVADTDDFFVRIGIIAGKKRLEGILRQDAAGAQSLPVMENDDAPGVSNGTFTSLGDPVVAPNGRFGFAAKVGGVSGSEDSGVWTTAFNGTLQLALQEGQPVPGLSGETVKSISSISLRDGHLLALIKVAGPGVNRGNDTVLLGQSSPSAATVFVRTGEELTVDGESSTVQKLTVFTPAESSAGHGRYHADSQSVARVTLKDKRTVLLRLEHNGTLAALLFTGQSASNLVSGAVWNTLELPVIGSEGSNFATLGTVAGDDIRKSDSSVLVYSTTGASFVLVAREGEVATDETGAQPGDGPRWSTFSDPVVNDQAGSVAFLATLNGGGVKRSTRSGLWFARPGEVIKRAVRLGDAVPDFDGRPTDAVFSDFVSIALPGGTGGGPIFLAKLNGPGVGKLNEMGLYSVNGTTGRVRKLLRTGDPLGGGARITRLTVLQPASGVQGATRSFNNTTSIIVHVTLSDKRQVLLKAFGT